MSELKFFSEEWCEQALIAEREAAVAIYNGFKDATTFTHVLALECIDRPDLITHIQYVQGKSVKWTTNLFPEDEVWARFRAKVEHWRQAAEGVKPGSDLIMAGRIKLAKGTMTSAVENAGAFNNFVASWGKVSTDWNV